ncbi:serine protease [Clostridium tarantellae]|uniref:Serine protease n=1 Tax=Clostridium tarantellae TaxID=39493 RepID=A0A6I1MP43_9CLOT|nr:serine protease [Clostridium tarantellae]MPQ44553.1 serine protease [Clostridium tarantellae]
MNRLNLPKIILYIARHNHRYFTNFRHVVGVGLGFKTVRGYNTGELCIHVLVTKKVPYCCLNRNDCIPKTYKGIKTDVVEVGFLRTVDLTDKIRPLQGGYAISPQGRKENTGSIGCIVTSGTFFKDYYILSNNHVLAGNNKFPKGTKIVQPAYTSGPPIQENIVASLDKFIPIDTSATGENLMDCAIAKLVDKSLASDIIAYIGEIKGIATPTLGLPVKKVGVATGLNAGTISTVGASVHIFNGEVYEFFVDQIISTNPVDNGDSGALVFSENNKAVGLLFSGSELRCIFTDIKKVLKALKVNIYTR